MKCGRCPTILESAWQSDFCLKPGSVALCNYSRVAKIHSDAIPCTNSIGRLVISCQADVGVDRTISAKTSAYRVTIAQMHILIVTIVRAV